MVSLPVITLLSLSSYSAILRAVVPIYVNTVYGAFPSRRRLVIPVGKRPVPERLKTLGPFCADGNTTPTVKAVFLAVFIRTTPTHRTPNRI